jgi:hypothetical protein
MSGLCQRPSCNGTISREIANMAFCSQSCHDYIWNNYNGASILPVHNYRGTGALCCILGSDRKRRKFTRYIGIEFGLEIAGGARDEIDNDPIDCAIREFREEFGVDIDIAIMRRILLKSPIQIKAFRKKFYIVFSVHMTNLSTKKMHSAWKVRKEAGADYSCIEMDKFYHVMWSGQNWIDYKTGRSMHICDCDRGIIYNILPNFPNIVKLTSLNKTGAWNGGYITQ